MYNLKYKVLIKMSSDSSNTTVTNICTTCNYWCIDNSRCGGSSEWDNINVTYLVLLIIIIVLLIGILIAWCWIIQRKNANQKHIMLNKILEYEKQAMNDKLHQGVCIGLAVEDCEVIKMKYAKIEEGINNLVDWFDFSKDKFLVNPGIYPQKPVKKIYENIHRKIILDIEDEGSNLYSLLGPTKAPGQNFKLFDYRKASETYKDAETRDHSLTTSYIMQNEEEQQLFRMNAKVFIWFLSLSLVLK